jgi:hypothetical protein
MKIRRSEGILSQTCPLCKHKIKYMELSGWKVFSSGNFVDEVQICLNCTHRELIKTLRRHKENAKKCNAKIQKIKRNLKAYPELAAQFLLEDLEKEEPHK